MFGRYLTSYGGAVHAFTNPASGNDPSKGVAYNAADRRSWIAMKDFFLPLEVLLVTLILHQLLNYRDKRSRLRKLNMVIGAFYSEVGRRLLAGLCPCTGYRRHSGGCSPSRNS